VAGLPFQPTGPWRWFCHPKPGHERVSIAMLAATHDRFVSYAPGGSAESPNARYPGMEATRDAWLAALRIRPTLGAPTIDRSRDYATGLSAGGGMALQLALEAPDLVAAIAPVAPLPFQPTGPWRHFCHPQPGHERVSIAMLAATHDRFVSYAPGGSPEYPNARYPGMEATRDAWLAALGIQHTLPASGAPIVDAFPDLVRDDSLTPATGLASSTIERQRYPAGPDGQELWYYKAIGMGHWWPHPTQSWPGLWNRFGKTNQDIDFADEAWTFFQRHRAAPHAAAPETR